MTVLPEEYLAYGEGEEAERAELAVDNIYEDVGNKFDEPCPPQVTKASLRRPEGKALASVK